jgi:hypothetical protein
MTRFGIAMVAAALLGSTADAQVTVGNSGYYVPLTGTGYTPGFGGGTYSSVYSSGYYSSTSPYGGPGYAGSSLYSPGYSYPASKHRGWKCW